MKTIELPPELADSGESFDEAVKARTALLVSGGSGIAAAKMQAETAERAQRAELRDLAEKQAAKAEAGKAKAEKKSDEGKEKK